MAPRPLIILGSARSEGNTWQAVEAVMERRAADIVDLKKLHIGHYDYENRNREDDFLPLAERMVAADCIVFATPVYWYAMSALLKTMFDRFTDLITIRKDLGRALKDKPCWVIACGAAHALPEGFEIPFRATCDYLEMQYKACFYAVAENKERITAQSQKEAKAFAKRLFAE